MQDVKLLCSSLLITQTIYKSMKPSLDSSVEGYDEESDFDFLALTAKWERILDSPVTCFAALCWF